MKWSKEKRVQIIVLMNAHMNKEHRNPEKVMYCTNKTKMIENIKFKKSVMSQCEG